MTYSLGNINTDNEKIKMIDRILMSITESDLQTIANQQEIILRLQGQTGTTPGPLEGLISTVGYLETRVHELHTDMLSLIKALDKCSPSYMSEFIYLKQKNGIY